MRSAMRGKFITFEGIDGAGKSSHIAFVSEYLRAQQLQVVATREPGGTPLGETIRNIVLNQKMHSDTEALLIFASRREHVATVIEPALSAGAWVVCDRFTDSTYAYQCGGRGVDPHRISPLEDFVHAALQPDLTLLFDAPVAVARERLDRGTETLDKFEREQSDFFRRVRSAYLERAAQYPSRIKVIDSARSIDEIRAELVHHLTRITGVATTHD